MDEKENERTIVETNQTETIEAEDVTLEPVASGKSKKKWIVLIVVVVVVLVVGIAGLIWHEQPSFCGAICHEPMDTYLESYEASDSTALAKTHANYGYTCLDCHEAKLAEQATEGVAWATDNFTVDESGYLADDEIDVDGSEICLSCHVESSIIAATENFNDNEGYNPHSNHQGATGLDCESCHSMHGTQTLTCTSCHDLNVPAGWESVNE